MLDTGSLKRHVRAVHAVWNLSPERGRAAGGQLWTILSEKRLLTIIFMHEHRHRVQLIHSHIRLLTFCPVS